jgi:hypothetical protein
MNKCVFFFFFFSLSDALKYDPALENAVLEWMEAVLGIQLPRIPLQITLSDGMLLCR